MILIRAEQGLQLVVHVFSWYQVPQALSMTLECDNCCKCESICSCNQGTSSIPCSAQFHRFITLCCNVIIFRAHREW